MLVVVAMISALGAPASFGQDNSHDNGQDNPDPTQTLDAQFQETIRPILQQHCGECHWGDEADAGVNLEPDQTITQVLAHREDWEKVLERVAAREMPPAEQPPLSEDEHIAVTQWIEQMFLASKCKGVKPGRPVVRRLNRTEYRNTVRDLTGVDFAEAFSFPGDDLGYGFDNVGDTLSIPPLLMEKYLDAATEIARQTMAVDETPNVVATIKPRAFFSGDAQIDRSSEAVTMYSGGTITAKVRFPEAGQYQITMKVAGDQAGSDAVRFDVSVNDRNRYPFATRRGRDSPETIAMKCVVDRPGKVPLKIAYINDLYDPAKKLDRNLYVGPVEITGPLSQGTAARRAIMYTLPDGAARESSSAQKILQRFAGRAFRRPVTTSELKRLMQIYHAGHAEESGNDAFESGIRLAIEAVLVSPHFLFKIESPVSPGETRPLDEYQLASSLSYFLWSTMPDGPLMKAAKEGKLSQPAEIRQQVQRMLADRRSLSLVQNFVGQWLQLRSLKSIQPDSDLYPGVDKRLLKSMATETKLLFADLMRRDASLTDLLSTEYSFVNEELARHYGIEGVQGRSFQRVSLAGTGRSGVLTHASILTLTSNPNRTSPVKRGKWIMENFLGEEPPPPDPAAKQLDDQQELTGTVRQQMEQHRANPACAVCHKVMDELGFALEHFDAVGRFRKLDGGAEIDDRGELPDGTSFEGPEALQQTIASKMRQPFLRCLTEKMLIYSLGRGLHYEDRCSVDAVMQQTEADGGRFSDLIHAITQSDAFRIRQGVDVE